MARVSDPIMNSRDKKVVKGEKREEEIGKSWIRLNREEWG
jgi:hypothetical protein